MKTFSKKIIFLSFFILFNLFTTIFLLNSNTQAKVKVKKITITAPSGSKTLAYVAKKKKIKLKTTVTVSPNKSKYKGLTYKSKNKKIAKVSKKGYVTGVKAGSTKIVVTSKKNKKKKKTIKVIVKKKAVTKITLNSTKLNMSVGDKKTINTNITPALNVYKKLIWKSSNPSIARVNSSGQVSALKEGNAKITCSAIDGSKKKAVCSVTIGPVISNISIQSYKTLTVTLSSPKAGLTKSSFIIKEKTTPSSSYNYALNKEIETISSTDKGKTYIINLDYESLLKRNTYIKVSIPSVNNISKELYIANDLEYLNSTNKTIDFITGSTENYLNEEVSISNSNAIGTVGNLTVSGNLPKGIKAYTSADKSKITFSGRPSQKTRGAKVTISGKDESGAVFTNILYFYIGEKDSLVAASTPLKAVAYTPNIVTQNISNLNGDLPQDLGLMIAPTQIIGDSFDSAIIDSSSYYVHVGGGSGNYIYEVDYTSFPNYEPNPKDNETYIKASGYTFKKEATAPYLIKVDKENEYSFKNEKIQSGTYNIKVKIWDREYENVDPITIDFPIQFIEGITIKGKVYDAANKLTKNQINILLSQKLDEYNNNYYSLVDVINGTYKRRILPGNYMINLSNGSSIFSNETSNQSINNNFISGEYNKDFKIPLYMVNIKTRIQDATFLTNSDATLDTNYDDYDPMHAYLDYSSLQNQLFFTKNDGRTYTLIQSDNHDISENPFELYAYLPAGSYTINDNNVLVKAWASSQKPETIFKDYETIYYYNPKYLTNVLTNGSSIYKLSGSFTVKNGADVILDASPIN